MGETEFKNKVEAWLTEHHYWFIKYWAGNRFTKKGVPDLLACIDGRFCAMELKGDGGRPEILQLVKLRKIRESGGIAVLLYPEDFDYFKAFLKGSEIGDHWYRENKLKQKEWFKKLSH